eukprot:870129_1
MDQTNEVSFIVLHDSYLVVIRFMFDHSVVKQMSFTNYFYQLLLPNTFTNYFYQILLPTTFTNYFYQHSLTNEFDQKRKSTRTVQSAAISNHITPIESLALASACVSSWVYLSLSLSVSVYQSLSLSVSIGMSVSLSPCLCLYIGVSHIGVIRRTISIR